MARALVQASASTTATRSRPIPCYGRCWSTSINGSAPAPSRRPAACRGARTARSCPRCPTHDGYVNGVTRAATELEQQRLLLDQDVQAYIRTAEQSAIGR